MTTKNQSQQVADNLTVGHFGSAAAATERGEPVTESMMSLTLDELVEYDRNPRRAPSAEYDTLRASYIKTGAAQTLLVVTRRPGEKLWFPAAGGNTRIRVLKELWKEFQDERYWRVNCKVVPFPGDTRVLVDHLAENDNRAEYIFIDRARTVCELHERLESEEGASLSQRAFIEKIRDMGYPKLSKTQLIRFQYAYRLYDLIPLALDGGMHIRSIIRLQETQGNLKNFLYEAIGFRFDPDRFNDHWGLVLQELDNSEGIDLDQLVVGLLTVHAPMAAERVPHLTDERVTGRLIRLWKTWSARADRQGWSVSLEREEVFSVGTESQPRAGAGRDLSNEELRNLEQRRDSDGEPGSGHSPDNRQAESAPSKPTTSTLVTDTSTGTDSRNPALPDGQEKRSGTPPGASEQAGESRKMSAAERKLRQRYAELTRETAECAHRFASHWDFQVLVFPIQQSDGGPLFRGFLLDLPFPHVRLEGARATAWKLLWNIAGVPDHPEIMPHLIDVGVVDESRQMAIAWKDVADGRSSVSRSKIATLPPGQRAMALGRAFQTVVENWVRGGPGFYEFIRESGPRACEDLFQLLRVYREIHETVIGIERELGK